MRNESSWFIRLKAGIKNAKFIHKMFAAFFLTSSVTIIPLGVYSYYQAHSNLLYQEKQSIREQIWQTNATLNNQIIQYQTVISSLLFNTQLQQCLDTENISYFQQYLMFENTLEPTIDSIISSHSNILLVKIFTDNETLKGHSKYLYALEDFPDELKDGRAALTYRITNNRLIAACRFPAGDKGLSNVLYIEFRIFDTLNLMLNNGYKLLLTDAAGRPIFASPDTEEYLRAEREENEPLKETFSLKGNRYFLFEDEIPETGWKSSCFVPVKSLDVDDLSILNATLLHLILAAFLCLVMSSILCRWLIGPLKNLQNNIHLVEEGDFTMEVSSPVKDEIGELTNAFGAMIKKLNVLVNEVYRSQIIQKEAEFKMLQAQLNPHFLYNTLSFINWSALRAGEKEIARVSRDISAFYRTALNTGKTTTTVDEEILNARSYINIQLALHNNSFDAEYHIEEDCRFSEVICNVFQPLIENALEHGIDKKRDGRGILRVKVYRDGSMLIMAVADNGPGFDRDCVGHILDRESSGYGLKNVNDRIRIFYGEEYGMVIHSREGEETEIEIRIPELSC